MASSGSVPHPPPRARTPGQSAWGHVSWSQVERQSPWSWHPAGMADRDETYLPTEKTSFLAHQSLAMQFPTEAEKTPGLRF